MSRIGKIPIPIPKGVEVRKDGETLHVKGPKGALSFAVPAGMQAAIDAGAVVFTPINADGEAKPLWGLCRALVENMIIGVTQGYSRKLEISGVGYKAEMKGKNVAVAVGFSEPKLFEAAPGITLTLDSPTVVTISGIDKRLVGQAAADLRSIRPPEPYKGKGIRYAGEYVRIKAGKAAVK